MKRKKTVKTRSLAVSPQSVRSTAQHTLQHAKTCSNENFSVKSLNSRLNKDIK